MPRVSNISIEINKQFPRSDQAIDVTERVHTLMFNESLLTGETPWVMEMVAENISSEEQLLFDDRRLALRLALKRDGVEQTSGWRLCTIEKCSLFYKGSTPLLRIEGNSLCSLMKQKQKWRAFVHKTPQFILEKIAAEYGLTVQSTALNRVGTWYQTGETDWEFLQSLATEVISATGQKRVWLMLDNRVLKFTSLEYAVPTLRRFGVGSGDDRADQVKFVFYGRRTDFEGGSQIRGQGFDIRNKKSLAFVPPDNAIPVLAGKLGRPYGGGFRQNCSTLQSLPEITDQITSSWVERTSKYFQFHTSLVGDVSLRVGAIVEVKATDPDNTGSSFNGKYPIYEVMQVYNSAERPGVKKGFTTHLGGFRRTFFYGDEAALGTNHSRAVTKDQYHAELPEQPDPITVIVHELGEFFN